MKILSVLARPIAYVPLAVIILGAGTYWYLSEGKTAGASITITPSTFTETVAVSGTVKAAEAVNLGFAQNGRVASIEASVGDRVTQGTLLAEIDNGDLRAAVSQANAQLASAEAQLAALAGGTRPEQLAVDESQVASAESAEAQAVQSVEDAIQNAYTQSDDAIHNKLDPIFTNARTNPKLNLLLPDSILQARLESERSAIEGSLLAWQKDISALTGTAGLPALETESTQNLAAVTALLKDANTALNEIVASQNQNTSQISAYVASVATARANANVAATSLTAAITGERSATATLATAKSTLALAKAGTLPADIDAQKAQVAAAQAALENARAALAKTQVVAPFDGVVTQMDAKVGQIVSPADSKIALMSTGAFQIEVYVPEVNVSYVEVGDLASTTLDAYGDSVDFPAKVIRIDPAETLKNGVPTYKTTLQFLTTDARIRSGMTSNVTIITGSKPDAIVLPAGAIGTDASGTYVSVLANEKVSKRPVTIGQTSTLGKVEILSGLSAGDVVLLAPQG